MPKSCGGTSGTRKNARKRTKSTRRASTYFRIVKREPNGLPSSHRLWRWSAVFDFQFQFQIEHMLRRSVRPLSRCSSVQFEIEFEIEIDIAVKEAREASGLRPAPRR